MKKFNEMGGTVNEGISKRDEYIAFSIIVNFEIMPNYSLVSHAPSPLLPIFRISCVMLQILAPVCFIFSGNG